MNLIMKICTMMCLITYDVSIIINRNIYDRQTHADRIESILAPSYHILHVYKYKL